MPLYSWTVQGEVVGRGSGASATTTPAALACGANAATDTSAPGAAACGSSSPHPLMNSVAAQSANAMGVMSAFGRGRTWRFDMRCVLEMVGRNTERELANGRRKEHANVDAQRRNHGCRASG